MAYQELDFGRGANRLTRNQRMGMQQSPAAARADGLVIATSFYRRWLTTLQAITLCVVWLFVFKALLLATVGGATYADRVSRLAAGNVAEVAGAWVTQPDATTRALSALLRQAMR